MRYRIMLGIAAAVLVPAVVIGAGPAQSASAATGESWWVPFGDGNGAILTNDGVTTDDGIKTTPKTVKPGAGVLLPQNKIDTFLGTKLRVSGLVGFGLGTVDVTDQIMQNCTNPEPGLLDDAGWLQGLQDLNKQMCSDFMTSMGVPSGQTALLTTDASLADIAGDAGLPVGWDRACMLPVATSRTASQIAALLVNCNGVGTATMVWDLFSGANPRYVVANPQMRLTSVSITGTTSQVGQVFWDIPGYSAPYSTVPLNRSLAIYGVCKATSTGAFSLVTMAAAQLPTNAQLASGMTGDSGFLPQCANGSLHAVYFENQAPAAQTGNTAPAVPNGSAWAGGVFWRADGLTVPDATGYVPGVIGISVDCTNGSETQVITVDAAVQVAPGQPFDLPEALCPPGWVAVGSQIGWTPDGGSTQTIAETEVEENTREMIDLSPDCFNGNQECVLELKQLLGAQLVSCGSIGQLCPDWASDPAAPDRYFCYYGGAEVDLNMCSAYRAPWVGPLPNLDVAGNIVPYTAPIPEGLPVYTGPGVPQADPRADCAASKPPSFWDSFSPYWIFRGVQCALIDTFVPRPTVIQTKAAQVATVWAETPPGLIVLYMEDLQTEVPEVTGCEGPHVAFTIDLGPIYVPVDAYPISACDPPWDTIANLARTLGGLAMLTGTGIAITRYIGATVNAPGLGDGGKS